MSETNTWVESSNTSEYLECPSGVLNAVCTQGYNDSGDVVKCAGANSGSNAQAIRCN